MSPLSEPAAEPRAHPDWCLAALESVRRDYVAAARRILRCPLLAEDVVQDVMLRLVAEQPPVHVGAPAAYVARMVRNLAIDRARRRRFEQCVFRELDANACARPCDVANPERSLAARQSLSLTQSAVAALPEPMRTVFRLHRIDGIPQSIIAARLGVSRAQICGLVHRGHVRCVAALGGACSEEDCPLDTPPKRVAIAH